MGSMILQFAFVAISAGVLGGLVAWSLQAVRGRQRFGHLVKAAEAKLAEVAGQRDALAGKYSRTKARLIKLKAASERYGAERDAALNKSRVLAKNVRILKSEREDTKRKLGALQNGLMSLKQQTRDLQNEFDKTREFYKRELLKSLQKRKELEEEVVKARAEQEKFAETLEKSVLEHGSEENMVLAAQLRLGQLEILERNVNKLETENAQLREEATKLRRDFASREKDLEALEELRVHNRQLVQAIEALEDSRREQEADAERCRQQAEESEKLSDTLRLKLDDLEKNFAAIEKQQDQALEDAREAAVVPILRQQG